MAGRPFAAENPRLDVGDDLAVQRGRASRALVGARIRPRRVAAKEAPSRLSSARSSRLPSPPFRRRSRRRAVAGFRRTAPRSSPGRVPAVADDLAAAAPDAVDEIARAAENPCVENFVIGAAGDQRRIALQRDDVGRWRRARARPQVGRAPALRRPPPRRKAAAPVEPPRRAQTLRARVVRRCAYSSMRSSPATVISTLESEPTPNRPSASRKARAGKTPSPRLASVIGQRPATAPRARERQNFALVDMGRVDEAPAPVDRGVIEEPSNRTRARPRDAGVDLAGLLGDVDVDRRVACERRDRGQFLGGRGAQRVRRDADDGDAGERAAAVGDERGVGVEIVDEAALLGLRAARRRSRRARRTPEEA